MKDVITEAEVEMKGHEPRNVGILQKLEKAKKQVLPQGLQKRQLYQHLDFSH